MIRELKSPALQALGQTELATLQALVKEGQTAVMVEQDFDPVAALVVEDEQVPGAELLGETGANET